MEKIRSPRLQPVYARIWRYFLTGAVVVLPVAGTFLILAVIFSRLDNILQPAVSALIRWFDPEFAGRIPGLGLLASVLLILGAGVAASNYAGNRVIRRLEVLLSKVPVFRQVYGATQRVTKSITGTAANRAAFRRVVFIEFPIKGVLCGAFVTNEVKDSRGKKYLALYCPTPPNPLSGYFLLVEPEKAFESNMKVDEAFKLAITGGLISPPAIDVGMPR